MNVVLDIITDIRGSKHVGVLSTITSTGEHTVYDRNCLKQKIRNNILSVRFWLIVRLS